MNIMNGLEVVPVKKLSKELVIRSLPNLKQTNKIQNYLETTDWLGNRNSGREFSFLEIFAFIL
jgi:hypothetical protein